MNKLLREEQKQLLEDGQHLLAWIREKPGNGFSDYSFLVAPFAKAYEGFLKVFFLKLGLISESQYHSDRFRVGKVLNPALQDKKWSVYRKLRGKEAGESLAKQLWSAWKNGRNLIFHYFPNNLHRLTFSEAEERIGAILLAIESADKMI